MISAVNGDLWLDNIGCFRYRVKLNNPLMGTETQTSIVFVIRAVIFEYVKLNNPLMGTETSIYCMLYLIFISVPVKLNNPLMGTETFHLHHKYKVYPPKVVLN